MLTVCMETFVELYATAKRFWFLPEYTPHFIGTKIFLWDRVFNNISKTFFTFTVSPPLKRPSPPPPRPLPPPPRPALEGGVGCCCCYCCCCCCCWNRWILAVAGEDDEDCWSRPPRFVSLDSIHRASFYLFDFPTWNEPSPCCPSAPPAAATEEGAAEVSSYRRICFSSRFESQAAIKTNFLRYGMYIAKRRTIYLPARWKSDTPSRSPVYPPISAIRERKV